MEIITDYLLGPKKFIDLFNLSEGMFRVSSQTRKSKVIEFFDDLYTYPPQFKVKWDSIDELHEDLFMSHKYRTIESNLPFLNSIEDFYHSRNEAEVSTSKNPSNTYIKGYFNKIVSTKFYEKQTSKIQDSLKNTPIYVILNGQGNIVLANSTDQHSNAVTTNNLYNFCGDFDPLTENSSQLGLFFMSRKDAELYLQEIAFSDTEGTKMFGLSIHCFGLDFAYRVMREHHPQIDFRIIPDLSEIQKLLSTGINKSNIIFDNEQQQLRFRQRSLNPITIGKKYFPPFSFLEKNEYFKGTPIYIVRVNDAKRNFFSERYYNVTNFLDTIYGNAFHSINFVSGFGNNKIMQGSLAKQTYSNNITNYIFFEQEAASEFCNNFKGKIERYNGSQTSLFKSLIRKPKIFVYNLEDFLELWEEKLVYTGQNRIDNNSPHNTNTIFDCKAIRIIPNKNSLEDFFQQDKKSALQKFKQFMKFKTRRLTGFVEVVLNTN